MFVRFIETCAMPYSSTYQPMALTCFNIPGMRTGSPFSSSTFLPVGRAIFRLDPPVFAHIERDRVGAAHRLRVEVHVVGDEEIPRPDDGRAGSFVEHRRSEIRLPGRLLDLLEEAFVFAGTNDREIRARRIARRFLVEINRDLQLLADPFAQRFGARDRFLPTHVAHRDERTNIGRAHPRMRALLFAHVDQFRGLLDSAKSRLHGSFRDADKGHDRAIGARAGIDVEQRNPIDRFNRGGDLLESH